MKKLIFLAVLLCSMGAQAQFNPLPISGPSFTRPGPVGQIYIRGLRYNDHSGNTTLAPAVANLGGVIEIASSSLFFEMLPGAAPRTVQVLLQDVNRPVNSFGVTVFELTSMVAAGTTLQVQLPLQPVFQGRSFHVTVFMIGAQPWHYAYAGIVNIQ